MKFVSKAVFSSATCLQSAALAAALIGVASAGAASAQTVTPAADCADLNRDGVCDSDAGRDIVVTGSRIIAPNLNSPVPVASINGTELIEQGQNSIGDALNDLPQLRSTFAQQNPGAGVGIAGLNLLDLRGLGTIRTLVLVNGRRHVAADILNNAASPDVNTIPADLVERVDIVTGGNSAVYGSDAIAGVVNFVLRRDFSGLQLRGNAGLSQKGYGGNQYVSAMAGKNFADGRGNITLHGEYAHQERIYARDIPFLRQVNGFATVDADSGGLANGSDGFPDAVFFRDIRSSTINRFGAAYVPQPQGTGACGVGTLANNGATNQLGTSYDCNYIFGPDGRLTPQTGTRIGTGPAGTFIGGNGQTGREGTLLSILPSNERYNFNMLAHYEVSQALELFIEAKYVRVNAVGNQLGPTFINNSSASFGADPRLDPRLDNPFLNPADRTILAAAITASNCGYSVGTAISAATCQVGNAAAQAARAAAVANGSYRFLFARNLIDSADRDEYFKRDTYRIVGGLRGKFNDDWHYELSVNYGKFKETADLRGYVNRQRFLLSLDAGRNPNGGAIQCRSQFDPAAATGVPTYANSAATLAADIAACVPYNAFGASDNSAAVAYFRQPIVNHSSIDQLDVLGFVGGDTSELFSLPGGPVSFVLGGEYRREKAFNDSDVAADTGIANAVFLGDVFSAPALKVSEAFAELRIPLLADVPFFHDLTASGAARVSHYNNATGTVYTYNGVIEWSPVQDLRFRGNYGRAVRAPNVSENGFPAVPNFANGFIDPCNPNAIANNPDRNTNCLNNLTAAQRANLPLAGYSLGIVSGSNPDLIAETSQSLTLGAVFQPRFLPGLSVSADFYNIKVKNAIVTLTAQTLVNACYDSPGFVSPLCSTFQRNLTAVNGPNGELPGRVLDKSVFAIPYNFASRQRRGLDVEAQYHTNLSDNLKLDTHLNYTHSFKNSNYENPALPNFENRIMSELGDPQDEFRWNVDLGVGPVTLGYQMRYIGPQLTSTYENFNGLNGQGPLNADALDITEYPAVVYHNLRFDIKAAGNRPDSFNFYFGVDNLTDKQPPLGTTATGSGSAIFSIRGRNFYAGFRARY